MENKLTTSLNGLNALICGATSGIGKAVAIEFSNLDANTTLFARNEDKLKDTLSLLTCNKNQSHQYLVGDFNNSAIDVARDVNVHLRKKLEEMRRDKVIGSSLDAEVDIYCNDENYQALGELKDELRFVFITSDARIHLLSEKPKEATDINKSLAIKVTKSSYQKCVRCWHHREEIGENEAHKDLCARCIENVTGEGETRVFA